MPRLDPEKERNIPPIPESPPFWIILLATLGVAAMISGVFVELPILTVVIGVFVFPFIAMLSMAAVYDEKKDLWDLFFHSVIVMVYIGLFIWGVYKLIV